MSQETERAGGNLGPLVAAMRYKPGWTFKLAGPGGRFLCVFARTPDSGNVATLRTTQHQFEIPDGIAAGQEFIRWAFDCLLLAELHECGEFFDIDGHRPFFPHHQDEGSPHVRVERWESTPWN